MSAQSEGQLREELAHQYRRTCELKLNELASGNLSCRFGEGMLISPTGASVETISPEAIVFVDADGRWEEGLRPSSEWRMHWAIYQRHLEARAVVHTHSDYCVAVACHNRPLPGFHYLVGSFGGDDVPCTPYYTFGSEALAESAAEALTLRTATLLGNHGMICRGRSLRSTVALAHRLEIMCRQYLLSRQLGEPSHLTASEWRNFFAAFSRAEYGR
jgi:L-fuculose-phosphate aldolase